MMSLWDALRMNMMISYQELVRTFLSGRCHTTCCFRLFLNFLFKRQKENETDV